MNEPTNYEPDLTTVNTFKEHYLEAVAVTLKRSLDPLIMQAYPTDQWDVYQEKFTVHSKRMIVELQRYLYREKIDKRDQEVTFEVEVPATWWQMFKRDCLPAWVVRRWPIRYGTLRVRSDVPLTIYAEYPGFIPPAGHRFEPVHIHEYPTPDPVRVPWRRAAQ